MKRRIVHVIESLGVGGAQAVLFELYSAIQTHYPHYEQSVILVNKKKIAKKYVESYNIPYEITSGHAHFQRTIAEYKEPVVIIFHKLMCSSLNTLRGIFRKIPIILVNHTYSENHSHNRINSCNAVVSVSNQMKTMLTSKFRISGLHRVIHNGVNKSRFELIKPRDREDQGNLITGRINALNTIKYSDSWIEWVSDVNLPKKLTHDYIGAGNAFKKANQIIEQIGGRNDVNMLGGIDKFKKKVSIIKSWDLFLYEINRNEGVSMSVLEALACGVPVICSNHHGNCEIIENGVNGYVFKDRLEAYNILHELASNEQKLKNLKRTTAEHFEKHLDAKVMASKYVDLIEAMKQDRMFLNQQVFTRTPSGKEKAVVARSNSIEQSKNIKRKRITQKPKRTSSHIVQKNKPQETEKEVKSMAKNDVNIIDQFHIEGSDKESKFTILTSAYNTKRYVADWSKSILEQKYRPLEVIVIDDCSKDDNIIELKKYAQKFRDAGIEYKILQNTKRRYCGSSYRTAWEHSTGYYFGVLDSDDMLRNDAVEYIMKLYNENPDIAWIYTQFEACDSNMKSKHKGFCCLPKKKPNGETMSLLETGKMKRHTYSHWRTFSLRLERPQKVWGDNLRCAVDKFMGYRLEEWGKGMFVNRVCYFYRQGVKRSISKTEETKAVWDKVVRDGFKRRKKYGIKPYPIREYKE